MATVRKITPKKKATDSASSGVHKRPHAKTVRETSNHVESNQEHFKTNDAFNHMTTQGPAANTPTNGKERARVYEPPHEPLNSFLRKKLARELRESDEKSFTDNFGPGYDLRGIVDPAWDPIGHPPPGQHNIFPFLRLSSELRFQIYQQLIPSGYDIFYNRTNCFAVKNPIFVTEEDKNGNSYERSIKRQVIDDCTRGSPRTRMISVELTFPPIELNLFLVNKAIYNEARAILYGQNTFNFNIEAVSEKRNYINIFGLFDAPARRHLLRDLRTITLHVEVNDGSSLSIERHRERLQQFMQELQKYSHDKEKKSLLRKLKVDWFTTSLGIRHRYCLPGMPRGKSMPDADIRYMHENQKKYVFGLEGLIALSGVDEVEITGAYVPPWFIECLTRCLKGGVEPPIHMEYPEDIVRSKIRDKGNGARRTYRKVSKPTKKWCDPWLNWAEFADREGIEIPEVDRLRFQGLDC